MKKPNPQNDRINVSGIHNSSVNIAGGDINNSTQINTGSGDLVIGNQVSNIDRAFYGIYKALERVPDGVEKEEAQETIKKLETEAKKGDDADENRVGRWLNFLAETAPDVWQVAVATFMNPIAGVSLVFKKVAERAKNVAK